MGLSQNFNWKEDFLLFMTRRSLLMGWFPMTVSLRSRAGHVFSSSSGGHLDPGKKSDFDELLYWNQPNPQAVREVLSGKRTAANAAWWGFRAEDSTVALQAAFDSRAATVVIPFMGEPWITRPLKLRSNQKVIFEPGVLVLAKKGEFLGKGDSLLTAASVSNLVLRGYGATLRMHKKDYEKPPYQKAESRMGISIRGCKNVLIEGLRVENTGGDGFFVDGGGRRLWSEDITIRHCVSDRNYRQGISVISAVNLLVDDCVFSNTGGTLPQAGIDLEPGSPNQRLVNCAIRNCLFENNHGRQIQVYLRPLNKQSAPVSILFENCLARMRPSSGSSPGGPCCYSPDGNAAMVVGGATDDGPRGLIEFRNCTSENSCNEGALVYDKSAKSVRVRFVNCSWSNPWIMGTDEHRDYTTRTGVHAAVLIFLRRTSLTHDYGGVDFVNCHVYDNADRPAVAAVEKESSFGVHDLRGRISVHNPFGAHADLGPHPTGISLRVVGVGP